MPHLADVDAMSSIRGLWVFTWSHGRPSFPRYLSSPVSPPLIKIETGGKKIGAKI
jgi:hypothetical protein